MTTVGACLSLALPFLLSITSVASSEDAEQSVDHYHFKIVLSHPAEGPNGGEATKAYIAAGWADGLEVGMEGVFFNGSGRSYERRAKRRDRSEFPCAVQECQAYGAMVLIEDIVPADTRSEYFFILDLEERPEDPTGVDSSDIVDSGWCKPIAYKPCPYEVLAEHYSKHGNSRRAGLCRAKVMASACPRRSSNIEEETSNEEVHSPGAARKEYPIYIVEDLTANSLPLPSEFVEVDELPALTHDQQPEYPKLAKQAGISGRVWVDALIGTEGEVIRVYVARTSGTQCFDDAAVKAAFECQYKPALINGSPVACWVNYQIEFAIEDD